MIIHHNAKTLKTSICTFGVISDLVTLYVEEIHYVRMPRGQTFVETRKPPTTQPSQLRQVGLGALTMPNRSSQ